MARQAQILASLAGIGADPIGNICFSLHDLQYASQIRQDGRWHPPHCLGNNRNDGFMSTAARALGLFLTRSSAAAARPASEAGRTLRHQQYARPMELPLCELARHQGGWHPILAGMADIRADSLPNIDFLLVTFYRPKCAPQWYVASAPTAPGASNYWLHTPLVSRPAHWRHPLADLQYRTCPRPHREPLVPGSYP